MIHYVYKIIDPITKEYYIGVRSFKGRVEDDSYMGSMITWKPEDKSRLIKEVIKDDFTSRTQANLFERDLQIIALKENKDPLCMNGYISDVGFCTYGKPKSDETKRKLSTATTNHFKNLSDDEYNKFVKTMRNAVMGIKNPFYGRRHTDETKKQISKSHPYPTRGKSFDEYYGKDRADEMKRKISESALNRKKLECPYCSKLVDPGNAKQFHFDRCKYKIK